MIIYYRATHRIDCYVLKQNEVQVGVQPEGPATYNVWGSTLDFNQPQATSLQYILMSSAGYQSSASEDPPPRVHCFKKFQFPVCYYQALMIFATFVLGIFVAIDLIVKVKHRRRIDRKTLIIGLLLLECICFLVLNTDRSLLFFYFVCFYIQDLILCAILYYYSRKAIKLLSYQRLMKWVKAPPIAMAIGLTGMFGYYVFDYFTNPKPIACQQTRYTGLGIATLVLSLLLIVLGIFLTVIVRNKLKDPRFDKVKKEKHSMLKKFWIFLVIISLSHIVSVIENRIIGDDHYCMFFPNSPVGDTLLKLFCNILGFFLPVIIVLINFRTVIQPQNPDDNRHFSEDLKVRGLLHYSHQDSFEATKD